MKHCHLYFSIFLFVSCLTEKGKDSKINLNTDRLEIFAPGIVSSAMFERDIAIDSAGTQMFFTLGNLRQKQRNIVCIDINEAKIYVEKWLFADNSHQDIEPFLSPDGKRLYFASDRPIYGDTSRSDYNIWHVERDGDDWKEPEALDSVINTKSDEFYPSIAENGNLYFTATRKNGIGREDIFLSRWQDGKYQLPEPLDTAINSATFEFNAYVNSSESLIIFSSFGRSDGFGGGDLYFSRKDDTGKWSQARNMGPEINTDALDYSPFIDEPRASLYFTSDRSKESPQTSPEGFRRSSHEILNGMGNIYRVPLALTIIQD